MDQPPEAPLTARAVLENGFKLFRTSFHEIFLLAFIGAVAGQVPSQMLGVTGVLPGEDLPKLTVQVSFALVGAVIIGLVMYGAVIARMHAIATGAEQPMSESIQIGLRKGPAVFVAGVIFFFAVFFGFLALIIPGVILSVSLMFCFYAVVLKDMGPLDALIYSHRLVWGYWWHTAGLLASLFLVLLVLYSIIGVIVGVTFVTTTTGADSPATFPWYINLLVLPLISAAITPLIYAISLAIYYDLEHRQSGAADQPLGGPRP